jgi:hypothetical protein
MRIVTLCMVGIGCTSTQTLDASPVAPTEQPTVSHTAPVEAGYGFTETPFQTEHLSDTSATTCLVVEDIDHDGFTDVLWIDGARASVGLRWGNGRRDASVVWIDAPWIYGEEPACALDDFDGDGDLDLLTASGAGTAVLTQVGARSFTWTEASLALPSEFQPHNHKYAVITTSDLNNDGVTDLLVGLRGSNGNDCTIAGDRDHREETDGDPYVPGLGYCLIGQGGGVWARDTEGRCPANLFHDGPKFPFGAAVVDLDDDNVRDSVWVHDFGANDFLQGMTSGLAVPAATTGIEEYNHAMGLAIADFNGDTKADLYVTDIGDHEVYAQGGACSWFASADSNGAASATGGTVSWGVVAQDFDANGSVDVLSMSSMEVAAERMSRPICELYEEQLPFPPAVLLDNHSGRFHRIDVPVTDAGPAYFSPVLAASGDLDGDGRSDVVSAHRYGLNVLWNEVPAVSPTLHLRLSTADGVPARGASVKVVFADGASRTWFADPGAGTSGHNELSAHIATGQSPLPADLWVTWPDGQRTLTAGVSDLATPIELFAP